MGNILSVAEQPNFGMDSIPIESQLCTLVTRKNQSTKQQNHKLIWSVVPESRSAENVKQGAPGQVYDEEYFCNDDDKVKFYTGLPS